MKKLTFLTLATILLCARDPTKSSLEVEQEAESNTMKENAARRWMRCLVRRVFCRHALAWVRNIHGDEINATGCRTVWICEKCGKYIYDRDYITKNMACVVYDPTNAQDQP